MITYEAENNGDAAAESTGGDIIQTADSSSFATIVLDSSGAIAVEFMSYGCVHCRTLEPVLQQAAVILQAKEKIVRVNTALEADLTDRYDIVGTPTFIMFLNGLEVGRADGPAPRLENILKIITQPYESLRHYAK